MRIHPEIHRLAAAQDDIVAVWQLARLGWTKDAIAHRTAGFTRLHDGVLILGGAAPTPRQRWRAATLTAPASVLSHASAGAAAEFRPWSGTYETVTRPGSGGPRRVGGLLVLRSTILEPYTTTIDGLPVTTAARTLADLAVHLTDREIRKCFRGAIRRKHTTAGTVWRLTARHPRRLGSAQLAPLAALYVRLPIKSCRSDAEAMGLEVLDRAGVVIPLVNRRFAGEEADFCWSELRLIIEIDGPDFHRFKDEDARKTAAWRAAGYDVRRIPSDDVFDRPERLLALAPRSA